MKEYTIRQTLDTFNTYLTKISPVTPEPGPIEPKVKNELFKIYVARPRHVDRFTLKEDPAIRPLKLEIAHALYPDIPMEALEKEFYIAGVWYAKDAVQDLIEGKGCQSFLVDDEYEDIPDALEKGAPLYGAKYYRSGEPTLFRIMYFPEVCAYYQIQ